MLGFVIKWNEEVLKAFFLYMTDSFLLVNFF